ncbi:MAG TPA: STAS domain-containing protein [Solirubrobacteraceae bacterium]|nr:STAS domain-containing protein [Solirubrobacteraceae bacterium]
MLVAGGDIDFAASPQLRERLADYVSKGKRHLVVDLSAVTFIDSTAIGVLVGAVMRLREHEHGTMTVVCAEENKRVLRIFDIAGVENLIELHGSRAEALLALAMAS